MRSKESNEKLLIIGLDAGDPNFIKRWADEGYLPTIASIMKQGSWGLTSGPELISEHGVWVSLFSGISRGKHGYYYFRQLKPGTYDLESITGHDVDAPPFWSRLLRGKKKAAIIDVPDTPLIKGLKGIQLLNWDIHDSWNPEYFSAVSEPPEVLKEVRRRFGNKLPSLEKHESSLREDRKIYNELIKRIPRKGALCRYILNQDSFDLIVLVFSESHMANHQFWKYLPEISRGEEKNELSSAIRDVYQAIDREIARILDELTPEYNVFVVSSVGMEDDFPTTGLIEDFLKKLGYQITPEKKNSPLRPIDIARRIIPESLRIAISRHLPRETRESLMADIFRNGTDWKRTLAFAIPSAYTSFIRVNLHGREPQGTVKPGTEYHEMLNRLEADLRKLIDPETKEPAVVRVSKTVEIFNCPPHPVLPDIFVEWKPGRFMNRLLHPRAEITQKKPDFYRRSDHSQNGFFAAKGPRIKNRGFIGEIPLLALAPTFLSLLGEPIPEYITGDVLESIMLF
ncbi:MAG: phosphodiesterase [Deltaproteobacteria bacterium]|nr:MAG: phosphodiesterase [Deltaproteobacteria bacterium]